MKLPEHLQIGICAPSRYPEHHRRKNKCRRW